MRATASTMTLLVKLLAYLTIGTVISVVRSDDLPAYTTCSACVEAKNAWIEDCDCNQKCTTLNNPNDIITSAPWRKRVVHSDNYVNTHAKTYKDCSVMEDKCTIVNGIKNPGFESNGQDWNQKSIIDPITKPDGEKTPPAFEGNYYAWLCGVEDDCTSKVSQSAVIPKEATHLSLYTYSVINRNSFSMFTVMVDNTPVFRLDKYNCGLLPSVYSPLDVNIQKYADGKSHEISLDFVEYYQGSPSQVVIDYVNLIKREKSTLKKRERATTHESFFVLFLLCFALLCFIRNHFIYLFIYLLL